MVKLIAANFIVWFGLIGCYALPHALDTEHKNGIAITEERNINTSPVDQVVIDLTSEEFKQANEHANKFLRANRQNQSNQLNINKEATQ